MSFFQNRSETTFQRFLLPSVLLSSIYPINSKVRTKMITKIHPIILVGLGGLFGAILRYSITLSLKNYHLLPIGTLVVNVIGSFALGAVFALLNLQVIEAAWIPLIGTGFMGSFTTMSAFAVETLDLSSSNSLELALINFLLMMGLVFVGAILGRGFVTVLYPIMIDVT